MVQHGERREKSSACTKSLLTAIQNNYQKNVDWADLKVRYWYTIEGCGEYSAFVRCGGASSYDDGTYVHVSTSDCLPYSFETKFCDPILMNSC